MRVYYHVNGFRPTKNYGIWIFLQFLILSFSDNSRMVKKYARKLINELQPKQRIWIRIQIQHFMSTLIRIQIFCFNDHKLYNFTADKNLIFVIKSCNLFIPRTLWRTSKLQEKPSTLNREHSALQNMKSFFFYFLGHLGLLDPDPADYNQWGSGSGSIVRITTIARWPLGSWQLDSWQPERRQRACSQRDINITASQLTAKEKTASQSTASG